MKDNNPKIFNIDVYGAVNDGTRFTDIHTTSGSTTITSATAAFKSADIGKSIRVWVAGVANKDIVGTITGVTNSTAATISVACSVTISTGTTAVYGTDSTVAIQNAWNAADAAGGGTVWIPNGVYIIAGGLQTSIGGVNPNCQLYMPIATLTDSSINNRKHFTVQGEVKGGFSPIFFASGTSTPLTGSILYTLINGSGVAPAVFGTKSNDNTNGNISFNYVTFKDFSIVTNQDINNSGTTIGGINMYYSASLICENMVVTTDGNVARSVQPNNEVAAYISSKILSEIASRISNSLAVNFKYGAVVSDDTYIDNFTAWFCQYAFVPSTNTEIIHVTKLVPQWCNHWVLVPNASILGGLVAAGKTMFKIDYAGGEVFNASGNWYDYVDFVNDTGNNGYGEINYTTILAGSIYSFNTIPFTLNGGANLITHKVGIIDYTAATANSNVLVGYQVTNSSNGNGAQASFQAVNDTGSGVASLRIKGSGAAAYGTYSAGTALFYSNSGGGLALMMDGNADMTFSTGTGAPAFERMRIKSAGHVLVGTITDDGINQMQISAATNPLKLIGLSATTADTSVLSVDTSGSIHSISTSNLHPKGQVVLSAGTKTVTINGLTTNSLGFPSVLVVSGATGATPTFDYTASASTNSLTIRAVTLSGTTNTGDSSTVNYFVLV